MDEAAVLLSRTKSKRTRSSNSHHNGERASKASALASPASTGSTPHASQPNLISCTSSAPLGPLSNNQNKLEAIDDDVYAYSPRDSVASIREDPFFRNYQSPHSVSLGRELRSATFSQQRLRDEDMLEDPHPRSERRPAATADTSSNSVNLPVRLPLSEQLHGGNNLLIKVLLSTAPIEKRNGGYQYCNNWQRGSGEEYAGAACSRSTQSADFDCLECADVGR